MDDPRCGQTIGRIRYGHRYQGLGVICIDCGAREIKTSPGAVEPLAGVAGDPTMKPAIVGIAQFKTTVWIDPDRPDIGPERFVEHVLVATSDGVFERGEDGVFRECEFERKGNPE